MVDIYERLQTNLKKAGYALDQETMAIITGSGPRYAVLTVTDNEIGTFQKNESEAYSVKQLTVEITFKNTDKPLNATELFVLAEEANCCNHIMKRMESAPIVYIDEDFMKCSQCSYWTDKTDATDYGTCTCRFAREYECRVMMCHRCSLTE